MNVYVQWNGWVRHNPTCTYLDLFMFYCIHLRQCQIKHGTWVLRKTLKPDSICWTETSEACCGVYSFRYDEEWWCWGTLHLFAERYTDARRTFRRSVGRHSFCRDSDVSAAPERWNVAATSWPWNAERQAYWRNAATSFVRGRGNAACRRS
jgi:hypothetical protein